MINLTSKQAEKLEEVRLRGAANAEITAEGNGLLAVLSLDEIYRSLVDGYIVNNNYKFPILSEDESRAVAIISNGSKMKHYTLERLFSTPNEHTERLSDLALLLIVYKGYTTVVSKEE